MVPMSRTSGLAVVYSELLSFEGCELYFHNDPRWKGVRFDRLQYHFPDGVPIGIRNAEGEIVIRPGLDVVLDEDHSTIEYRPQPVMIPKDRDVPNRRIQQRIERQLILGWSYKAPTIIQEYADYVLEGSEVDVMVKDPPPKLKEIIQKLDGKSESVQVRLIDQDPLVCEELEAMNPFSLQQRHHFSQETYHGHRA
jgi:hypothetical protein